MGSNNKVIKTAKKLNISPAARVNGGALQKTGISQIQFLALLRKNRVVAVESGNFIDLHTREEIVIDSSSQSRYIAFASSDSGADFTLTHNPALEYMAIKFTEIPIESPSASDFSGLWFKRIGVDGTNGTNGTNGDRAGTTVTFLTSVTNADPSALSGQAKLDSAVAGSITVVRLDDLDKYGVNVEGVIQRYKAGDFLEMKSNSSAGTSLLVLRVTAKAIDRTGYWDVPVIYVSGTVPTTNLEVMALQHIVQGNKSGIAYNYNTDLTGDPGAGLWEANTTTTASIVTLRIDDIDANGIDRSVDIATWKPTGQILIEPNGNSGTRFARFLITAIVDSGTYFTITVVYQSGVNFSLNDACVINYIPGPNMTWNGTDILDGTTGDNIGLPLTYDTIAEAITATPAVLNNKVVVLKKLVNNPGAQPCAVRSDGTKFSVVNGKAVSCRMIGNKKITAPAATWVGTYTFAAGAVDAVGTTKIDGAGNHGLTTAASITAQGTPGAYIAILPGSGANWVPGLYKLMIIEDGGDELTINHPYSASFGQPVFGLVGSNFEAYRFKNPPMSSDGVCEITSTFKITSPTTVAKAFGIQLVAAAGAVGSGFSIFQLGDDISTNSVGTRGQWGFLNACHVDTLVPATNVQHRLFGAGDPNCWGQSNGVDPAVSPGAIETNVATEILVTVKIGAPNETINMKNILIEMLI